MKGGPPLVAHAQAAEPVPSLPDLLHHPAHRAQPAAVLSSRLCQQWLAAPLPHPVAIGLTALGRIAQHGLGPLAWTTARRTD